MDITGLGSAFEFGKAIIDRVWPKATTEEEKLQAVAQMLPLVEQRETALLEAQKAIIVAELQQSDNFTKRARPSVVYVGLIFIGLVHVVFPMLMWLVGHSDPNFRLPELALPEQFWWAWGGIVATWQIARSFDKNGATNKALEILTGNKK